MIIVLSAKKLTFSINPKVHVPATALLSTIMVMAARDLMIAPTANTTLAIKHVWIVIRVAHSAKYSRAGARSALMATTC